MACSFFDTNSSQKPNKKEQVRHANAKTSDKSSYKRSEDRNEEPACRGVGYKWFRRQAAKSMVTKNLLQSDWKTGTKNNLANGLEDRNEGQICDWFGRQVAMG